MGVRPDLLLLIHTHLAQRHLPIGDVVEHGRCLLDAGLQFLQELSVVTRVPGQGEIQIEEDQGILCRHGQGLNAAPTRR